MRRMALNLLALSTVLAGSAHLLSGPSAAQISPPTNMSCCTSPQGAKCCGTGGCSVDVNGCLAW